MEIRIPQSSLILLVGPSGAGKSAFAGRHFRSTQIVSSDNCRALIADDENNQQVTDDAFEVVHTIVDKRLKLGRLTVVDATNVQPQARRPLLSIAARHRTTAAALVFKLPLEICLERNQRRTDRQVPEDAIVRQHQDMLRSIHLLADEGCHYVFRFASAAEIDSASFRWLSPDSGE